MHICHEEIFALMQVAQSAVPGLKLLVNRLRIAFHKDRPHPTCNDHHLTVVPSTSSNRTSFRCACGTTFTNTVFDPEANCFRAQCPNCGATA